MIKWFTNLGKAMHKEQSSLPYREPSLTKEEVEGIQHFFTSPPGQALIHYMIWKSACTDSMATMQADRLTHSCGYAAGYKQAVNELRALSDKTIDVWEIDDSPLAYLRP